jgi:hypothetical protein
MAGRRRREDAEIPKSQRSGCRADAAAAEAAPIDNAPSFDCHCKLQSRGDENRFRCLVDGVSVGVRHAELD